MISITDIGFVAYKIIIIRRRRIIIIIGVYIQFKLHLLLKVQRSFPMFRLHRAGLLVAKQDNRTTPYALEGRYRPGQQVMMSPNLVKVRYHHNPLCHLDTNQQLNLREEGLELLCS